MKPKTINPNKLKTRDVLLVKLINGATKANTTKDQRKERSRRECRDWKHDQSDTNKS